MINKAALKKVIKRSGLQYQRKGEFLYLTDGNFLVRLGLYEGLELLVQAGYPFPPEGKGKGKWIEGEWYTGTINMERFLQEHTLTGELLLDTGLRATAATGALNRDVHIFAARTHYRAFRSEYVDVFEDVALHVSDEDYTARVDYNGELVGLISSLMGVPCEEYLRPIEVSADAPS